MRARAQAISLARSAISAGVACGATCSRRNGRTRSSSAGALRPCAAHRSRSWRQRDGVERAGFDVVAEAERAEPVPQLAGRLAGEGDAQDVAGVRLAGGDAVGEPGGEHPRLARAGGRDDGQGHAPWRSRPGVGRRRARRARRRGPSPARLEAPVGSGSVGNRWSRSMPAGSRRWWSRPSTTCPEPLAARLDNVMVRVRDGRTTGSLLGLYEGIPLTERDDYGGWGSAPMPDQVTIYRLPICAICETEAEVADQVRITVDPRARPPLRHRRRPPRRARLGLGSAPWRFPASCSTTTKTSSST